MDKLLVEPIPAVLRRERMHAVINKREFMRVTDLSAMFGISEVTVRSDLRALAQGGRVRRIRGGALRAALSRPERPFEQTEVEAADEKAAIGAAAAALVTDQETVILDVGTTSTAVARALVRRTDLREVVVITNGLNIALELEPAIPRFAVVVTGGTLRPLQHSLVDPLAGEVLDHLNVNTVFLGCNGVDPEGGVTNVNLPEAAIKRRMLQAARRRVVVADGSKVGRLALAQLCEIQDVDLLITSQSADPAVLRAIEDLGVDVQVVG